MRAMSAGVSVICNAPSDSVSCVRVRAPINGTMAGPFASTQAIASCEAVAMLLGRQLSKRVDETLVLLEVLAREARQMGAKVAWGVRLRATQQPAGQHTVGGDADAEFRQQREDRASGRG